MPLLLILFLVAAFGVVILLVIRRRAKTPFVPDRATTEVVTEVMPPAKKGRLSQAIGSWIPLLKTKIKDHGKWEEVLIMSDMGPRLTQDLLKDLTPETEPESFFKSRLTTFLAGSQRDDEPWKEKHPWVIFTVGVNGVGKTTTVVKLAHYFKKQNLKVAVIGADTFRKAAIEQLHRGCDRIGVEFFTLTGAAGSEGADPSAVVFDGLKKFTSADIILVDTSGRLHNKKNLMDELTKMKRVAAKASDGAPHDIWMVVDATLGQNAVQQGRSFQEALGLTGLLLTKMDGLSRGGTIFQVFQELKTPIRFLGFGEKETDLEAFNSAHFIQELFDLEGASS